MNVKCSECNGRGRMMDNTQCHRCAGAKVEPYQSIPAGQVVCPGCQGKATTVTGYGVKMGCTRCKATGYVPADRPANDTVCPACSGTGFMWHLEQRIACQHCDGKRRPSVAPSPIPHRYIACNFCGGNGGSGTEVSECLHCRGEGVIVLAGIA